MLERDLAYVDRVSQLDLDSIELNALDALLDALFGSYRAGDLLAGRLPLVLEGALDELDPARVDAIADRLAAVDDIQVIVVAGDTRVADALDRVGGARRVSWSTNGHHAATSEPEPVPAGAPSSADNTSPLEDGADGRCRVHADKDAAAVCAQCGRPSCVDCLVYLPGESELACRTCAEAMHGRTLRLLRRRGA